MESISFDRATAYYDRTRGLSRRAVDEVTSLLMAELGGRGRSLEIGIGTGRIALPLKERGADVWGVDLSPKMLGVLRGKSTDVPVAVADATRLPFPDDAFGASFGCHVLHLIPRWRDALAELTRVVRPGGIVLIDLGGWGGGDWEAIQKRFVTEAGINNPRPGATDPDELDETMADLGGKVRLLHEVVDSRTYTYAELIDRIEEGLYSFTWSADTETRVRVAGELRGWTEGNLGELDIAREYRWVVQWRAYDLA